MGSEWEAYKLSDIINIIGGGTPKRSISEYWGGEIPWLSVKDFNDDFRHVFKADDSITEEGLKKSSTTLLKEEQIIISARGTVGALAQVSTDMAFNQSCYGIDAKKEFTNNNFLYYLLKYSITKLKQITHGAVFDTITKETFNHINVSIPTRLEQKAIAHILGSLDDKIELNHKMNETLEAMAQALFKSWFVDFDPVIDNAMEAGNEIPEELMERAAMRKALGDKWNVLPDEVKSLFPSEFKFTDEMGWVPLGWKGCSLVELLDSISVTHLFNKDKLVFLNTSDIYAGHVLHSDYSEVKGFPGQAKKSIRKDDILYSEIRPKNKRYAYIDFMAEDYVVSTKLMVLRQKSSVKSIVLYYFLKREETLNILQKQAEFRSGTFPQITFTHVKNLSMLLPPDNIMEEYTLQLEAIFNKERQIQLEKISLEKLRDTLLPRLLSGELQIHELEKKVHVWT